VVAAGDLLIDLSDPNNKGASIDVRTNADGIASCWWRSPATMSTAGPNAKPPQVTATLLIDVGSLGATHLPIVYSASSSVAKEVYFNAPPGSSTA